MKNNSFKRTVVKVGVITIIFNVLLSGVKLIGGILANASSLISDAVHSASDVVSTVIVMIGAKISQKEADESHPYGHERIESIASIILAFLLVGTAVLLGYSGIISIIEFANGKTFEKNDFVFLALAFALISILVKFLMYLYTIIEAKKINSTSLKADAYHHLSDSLSSIGSVLGIIGLIIGDSWAILDPIASIIISIFILKVAFDISKEAINQLVDKTAPSEVENKMKDLISSTKGVIKINSLKTRMFGNKYYVDAEIVVDKDISVKEGHKIATLVHNKIEKEFVDVKHIMIHVDPSK